VLDRLNRARFLWDKPAPAPQPENAQPVLRGPFDTPPAIKMPPHLPELAPRPAAPVPAMPAPVAAAGPLAAAAAVAAAPAVFDEPAPPTLAPAPKPKPAPPPRAKSVSLTPEERVELGASSWVEPAAGHSGQAPVTLDEATAGLAKAGDLDRVGEILLGFLGRTYRRAALFHVTRDRVAGWRLRGTGVDQDAFAQFSVGFDQPSLFLNLRQGSSLYLGPLPPMPAHRQLARAWGGDLPRDCVMLPVRVKERMVLVIYADGATGGAVSLPSLQQLAAAATAAVGRIILARKHGEAK